MKYPRTQRDFDAEFAERERKDYQRQYYTGCLPDVFRADPDIAMLFTSKRLAATHVSGLTYVPEFP